MSSDHELAYAGKQLTPAIELAYSGGDEAGLPLTEMTMSSEGGDVPYMMYDHQAVGLRGYARRFTQQPRSDNSSSIFNGQEQFMEFVIPSSAIGIQKQYRCELTVTFTDGTQTSGNDSVTILPSDQWISRLEVRGGGSAGSVLETVRGDVAHLERPYRLSEVEAKTRARDMLWGENDADLYMPAISESAGTQAAVPTSGVSRRYQIDLINPLTDAQVFAPALNLSQHPIVIRVVFRATPFSQDTNDNAAASVSVSAARFWIEEHVLNMADEETSTQVRNEAPMVFRCLSRQEFVRSRGVMNNATEYNELLQNLQGVSAGLIVYLKEDTETTETYVTTGNTATGPASPAVEGALATFHQLTEFRLLDRNNGPIVETETDEINRLSTQSSHLTLPIWYNDAAFCWYHYLIPFCDDFSAALQGQHTGARPLTGGETLYYTTAADAPTLAASIHVVSYDYASWVCRRGVAPKYLVARVGA